MSSEPRWHFLGHELRDGMAENWPPEIPVREMADDGGHVYRIQPPPVPRCICHGLKGQHGKDRRGRPTCFHSAVCTCTTYQPASVEGSQERHPAGKATPARFDERHDPSPEPIDRSIQ